ncbi:MAG: IS1634 family transposase [Gammaproteobacteria bacterium]
MYLDVSTLQRNGHTYQRVLLRESYRDQGKVKKRTLANLSACSDAEIEAIQWALRHKQELAQVGSLAQRLSVQQGPSIGAVWVVYTLARRLGIARALGSSREGKLALWQVIARVIDQGSRLSAVRFASDHGACDVLDLAPFHEDHLYTNLDWLQAHQVSIEKQLFEQTHQGEKVDLFLYDVTSSYLEGEYNELAAFGYNRDGKKGKRQIVIGLLCDGQGRALSIEVFPGNTQDTQTFAGQVQKVTERFGGDAVTFVGDRGMIKGPQIAALKSYQDHEFHYITALTKPQIEKLLTAGTLQVELFDPVVAEVQMSDGLRYVLRRNPTRAKELQRAREDKYQRLCQVLAEQNRYLRQHPRATIAVAQRKLQEQSRQLKIDDWIILTTQQRTLSVSKDTAQLRELEKLDGCYVLKTDLASTVASKELIHDRYKDLALVEWAFRTSKTVHLEMRPIHVRLATRTRGHALVVMLAYRIIQELATCWRTFDITVEEGLKELNTLCVTDIAIAGGACCHRIPEPRPLCQQLLEVAAVKLPAVLPSKGVHVATKKKLTSRRKTA